MPARHGARIIRRMWWPYRFRAATGTADPTDRLRLFAAGIAASGGACDSWVEATARTRDGAIDVWFRADANPSERDAWEEGLRSSGLSAERIKGRN